MRERKREDDQPIEKKCTFLQQNPKSCFLPFFMNCSVDMQGSTLFCSCKDMKTFGFQEM